MKKEQREQMYKNIYNHGNNLNNIFKTDYDNITLCKKLIRLERKAHKLSTDYCNGVFDCEEWEIKTDKILKKVCKILNLKSDFNIFVNGDCRGYALKIFDNYIRKNNIKIYKDWGGYGIIAPDFNPTETNIL